MGREKLSKVITDFIAQNRKNLIDAAIAGGTTCGGNLVQAAVGKETTGLTKLFVATLTTGAVVKATRKVYEARSRSREQK